MTNDKAVFVDELEKLLEDPRIVKLCTFPQHHGSNTLQHCIAVAKRSFDLAEKFGWDIDERELVRGAMLHDYYQYDIKKEGLTAYKHGTSHPRIAMQKADKDFHLTEKEKNIIRGHMWPLTLAHPPKSKEAVLVSLADKEIATMEFVKPELSRARKVYRRFKDLASEKK